MASHPLEPLAGDELKEAVRVLRETGELSEHVRFSCALPVEPDKAQVRAFEPGGTFDRQVRIVGYDAEKGRSFVAHVCLRQRKLLAFDAIDSGQAPIGFMDFITAVQTCRSDAAWIEAVKKRGIDDVSLVQIDPWPVGGYEPDDVKPGTRMLRCIAFKRTHKTDNGYARPLQGLIAWVDVVEGKVIKLEDHGVVPFPPEAANYDAESVGSLRSDLRPIEITQPEGPSFTVDGYSIHWQKWQLRVSLHPSHGLVLHDVGYDDQGRVRPILYRASLADMVVPYGDSSPMHHWKHVFDASETSIGQLANSLKLGCDCLGEIHYFDASFLGPNGDPFTIENAICLHEEDFGIGWKHTDMHGGTTEVRRQRRLVISSIHTVGNYEYGFFWYLYLDGTVQMEVKLTGIVGVSAVEPGGGTDSAPLVAPQLASPVHQHLFCFRLDFGLDGDANSVFEVNTEAEPIGPENPDGTLFRPAATALTRESEAQRNVEPHTSRYWKVTNPNVKNRLGQPVAYKLLPGHTPTLFAADSSPHGRRANFARKNLWVTAYAPDELGAAGDFTNQHPGGAGLPAYVAQDRRLENTDVVLWHSFGLTHIPRPEDWPVMPVEYCGFTLLPVGFFERNPALDVPPSVHCAS
jgi:primary-amine oxidase